jgi:hypothetical protein
MGEYCLGRAMDRVHLSNEKSSPGLIVQVG